MRFSICLALLIAGCGGPAPSSKPTSPPVNPPTVPENGAVLAPPKLEPAEKSPVAAEPWGMVQGRVVWGDAKLPKREPIIVKNDHTDHKFCTKDGPFQEETWIVDAKTRGLKNTFVWLVPAEPEGKLTIHPKLEKIAEADRRVVIDQPVCMFVPSALALREGQILVVKNSSKVLHNFKWGGNPDVNPGGNPSIAAGEQLELDKIKADRLLITAECGIHPWMKASILAFDHPYFAVTDAQGKFEIKNAPAGPCRIMIRHSTGYFLGGAEGRKGRPISIRTGVNDLGALEFPPPPMP